MSKYHLYEGDCLEVLKTLDNVDTLFADPPDNIGLGYGKYRDRLDNSAYVKLLRCWLDAFVLKAKTVWFSYNAKWTFEVGKIVTRIVGLQVGDLEAKPCVQTFSLVNTITMTWATIIGLCCDSAGVTPHSFQTPSEYRHGGKRTATNGRTRGDECPGMCLTSPG